MLFRSETVQAATGGPFDPERARQQLQKTGGTPFEMAEIALDADPKAFCPASALNALRRDALAALAAERAAVHRTEGHSVAPELPKKQDVRPLLVAQSADPARLVAALDAGADVAAFAPEDVRPEALERIDVEALAARGRVALAIPAVLSADALDGLNAWALRHGDAFETTYLSNIGQLGMDWPGKRVGDFLLNVGNDASVAQLIEWGLDGYTPSVELTAAQVGLMGGRRHLVMWGRLPLMHLRHCPLRTAAGVKGPHRDCRRCDACPPAERLNGKALIDRKGVSFPLKRVAAADGCVIQALNSAPVMPLRRLGRLPSAVAWRLLLNSDEPTEAVVRVYRAALDGRDFKSLPEWREIDAMNTTMGHYFRGVE